MDAQLRALERRIAEDPDDLDAGRALFEQLLKSRAPIEGKTLEDWIQQLDAPDPDQVRVALEVFKTLGVVGLTALPRIALAALRDKTGLSILRRFPDAAWLELADHLKIPEKIDTPQGLKALLAFQRAMEVMSQAFPKDPRLTDVVREALCSKDNSILNVGLSAASHMCSEALIPELTDLAWTEKRSPYLEQAVRILGDIGPAAASARPTITSTLMAFRRRAEVCCASLWALGRFGREENPQAHNTLRFMAVGYGPQDGPRVGLWSAYAGSRLNDERERLFTRLHPALESGDPQLHADALRILGDLGPEARHFLAEILPELGEHPLRTELQSLLASEET